MQRKEIKSYLSTPCSAGLGQYAIVCCLVMVAGGLLQSHSSGNRVACTGHLESILIIIIYTPTMACSQIREFKKEII